MGTAIDPNRVIGHKVVDAEGHKIGQAEEVYLDDTTGLPQWVTVKGGLFGGKEHFAPLQGATLVADEVQLTCPKSLVDGAPDLETGRHLSVEEERALYRHYGLGEREGMSGRNGGNGRSTGGDTRMHGDTAMGAAEMGAAGTASAQRPDAPAPARAMPGADTAMGGAMRTDAAMGTGMGTGMGAAERTGDRATEMRGGTRRSAMGRAMLRFEERLHIGTERMESGRARLRKQISTEQVRQTVPLMHQEVRIEREPIRPEDAAAMAGEESLSEAESEVTLYAERTVVSKQNVPVERVRMRIEEVTEQVTVTEEVRSERIDLESDGMLGKDSRMKK
jgi:uncharacterized protein (TIGR02271 family)